MTNIFKELDLISDIFAKDFKYLTNEDFKGHCITCKEPIIGKVTSFTQDELKSNFHQGCFKCANCSTSMDGKGFFIHQGRFLDQECYFSLVLGKCDGCSKVFTEATVLKAGKRQFHPACFTCTSCKEALTGSFVEKDSSIFCKKCYEKSFLPPCFSCKTPITAEAGSTKVMAIEWKDKKFHVACFACKLCAQPFADLKAVLHKEDLLCKPCFDMISVT